MRQSSVNRKIFCNSCGRNTFVNPTDNSKCSGCGKYYDSNEEAGTDFSDVITSQGMLNTRYKWVPITCTIDVDRQTTKSVHGLVTVLEEGEEDPVYTPQIYWVPKSMSMNPWFICTILYEEENKVANKRFDVW